jgi:hypothetical protein
MSSALRRTGSTRKWRRLRLLILQRDRWTCGYCGQPANTVDHIIPRNQARPGQADHPSNLVAACSDCNSAKGSRRFFLDLEAPDTPTPCPLSPHTLPTPSTEANYKKREASTLDLNDPGPLGRGVTR